MKSEGTKACQNCKQNFTIEPDDFAFYEKVKVPPPTFCPQCRFQRRLLWRNQWHLFKKTEARTGKKLFSLFSESDPITIYERDFWWSDSWDPMQYGREYDWSKSFFAQFQELLKTVPFPSRSINDLVNSDFSMNAGWLKNCYLVFDANRCEDCSYLVDAVNTKSSLDGLLLNKCELCYASFNLEQCYRAFFSIGCESCHEIAFCRDCVGCSNCFGCVNLRSKSFCIFNTQYSKEEYLQKIKDFNLGSFSSLQGAKNQASNFWLSHPRRYVSSKHNSESNGEYIFHSKNTTRSYRILGGENVKYCQLLQEGPNKDSYDYTAWGNNTELVYESSVCGIGLRDIKFCWQSFGEIRSLQFCVTCGNCSDCFGCVGIRNKQYCILNRQYSKSEYEKMVSRIIEHMNKTPYIDQKGRIYKYGEFFPPELSPFAYNETIAQEYFPVAKTEAQNEGLRWNEEEKSDYRVTREAEHLPDAISQAGDNILNEIIGCEHKGACEEFCSRAFRLTPQELEFYRQNGLPLPRLCFSCRQWERIRMKNTAKLYTRHCGCGGPRSKNSEYQNAAMHDHGQSHCPNEFETSYAPERPEIVYCEACYNSEVI